MTTNLCHACYEFVEQIRPEPGIGASNGVVHSTAASFFNSVDLGCLVCTYLHYKIFEIANATEVAHAARTGAVVTKQPFMAYGVYQPAEWEQKERRGGWLGVYLRIPSLKSEFIEVQRERRLRWVPEGETVSDKEVVTVYLEVCWPDPGRSGVPSGNLNEVQDLEERWPRIVNWLQGCLDGHPECVSNAPRAWAPSRLLDLGEPSAQEDTSPSRSLRLRLAEEFIPSIPYMTLSHCWGTGPQPLRLIQANLAELRAGISIDKLPATFQQAVAVTRRLGVRYLWIDSLCIIQDSKEDWFYESARMCDVYRNSYCNIAATSARNGTEGCFFTRRPCERPPWTFEMGFPPVRCEIYDYAVAGSEFQEAPLNSRAWVLQERLLSPRVLHFGRQRLYWECNRYFTYEDEPKAPTDAASIKSTRARLTGANNWHRLEDLKLGLSTTIEYERLHEPRGDGLLQVRETLYDQWLEIVQHYSSCNLTMAADKLIALAGVAKRIQPLLGDDYLAGIWRGSAIRDLLWTPQDMSGRYGGSFGKRPSAYRAPSWSWASLDGRMWFMGGAEQLALWNATVEEVKVVHSGDLMMGPFTDGFLRIRGKPFHSLWHGRPTQKQAYEATVSNPDASRAFFGDQEPSFDAFTWAHATLKVDSFDEHGLFCFAASVMLDLSSSVQQTGDYEPAEYLYLAVQIPNNKIHPPGHEGEHQIVGLFLRRVDRPGIDKAYRRAGIILHVVRGDPGLEVFLGLADETVVIV